MNSQKILKYWKESLNLLEWSQLKLIILASLNNFIRSTGLFVKYFWWLGILEISNLFTSNIQISTYNQIRVHLTHCIVFFAYLLCSRASTERKDLTYFWQYFKALPLALILLFPYNIIIIDAIFITATLFFLDSRFSFSNLAESAKNGLVYVGYFPAVTIIIDLVFWTIATGSVCLLFFHSSGMLFDPGEVTFTSTSEIALTFSSNLILVILRLIQLSFLSVLYLRIKHAFPDLFGAK